MNSKTSTMENKIVRISLGVFIILLIIGCIASISVVRQPYRAEKICQNLLDEKLLDHKSECAISREPRVYIPAMFPIKETTMDRVTKGMKNFPILYRTQLTSCDDGRPFTAINYALIGSAFVSYEVNFAFCGDELVNIHYSD